MTSYYKKYSSLIFIILLTQFIVGQPNSIIGNDSLIKVYTYFNLANKFKDDSLELAIKYNKKALSLANKTKSKQACGETNELMGELYAMNNNTQPAINYYLISAKIFTKLNNVKKLSIIFGNLGMLYYNNHYDTERTLFYYRKSLEYAVQINDKKLIADSYNRIGGILFNQKNYDDALYYFQNAKKLYTSLKNNKGIAIELNNIGEIYRINGDLSRAAEYYMRSIKLNNVSNYMQLKAINYENIGLINCLQGDIDKAFNNYKISLVIYNKINDINGLTHLLILMGDEYYKINSINKAYQSYNSAYKLAIKHDHWEGIKNSSLGLSKIFKQKQEYRQALIYINTYAQYNDSIINRRMNDQLFDLQSHFLRNIKEKELQIKDSDIELLKNEREINNLKQNIIILSSIVLIIITIFIIVRLRFKIKKEKLINKKDRQLHEVEQSLLKIELNSKDNDLTNFALHLVQKNKVLKELKNNLNKLSSSSDDELSRKLKELSIHVQQSLQLNKDIQKFQQKVDLAYDDFFRKLKLKFPNLTNNEKRLCALLRLNLTTKEISSINNTSIKAVEMSRYRLRKKFNINNGQSLSEYFLNI